MSNKTAKITIENQSAELSIYPATLGESVIDVKPLQKLDHLTFDPGFFVTAACESKITYIDGDKGVLLYRGYPIEQLSEQCDYMDVSYLLLYGELPDTSQKNNFLQKIQAVRALDVSLAKMIAAFPQDAHPMGVLLSIIGALSTCYPTLSISKKEDREKATIELIAKIPTIAAYTYRHAIQKPFIPPKKNLGFAENFLYMLFGDDEKKASNPILIQAMDHIFTLQADHEQNASTSTVRMAGSTGTNAFAAIAAGIAALWGPAHGGANEACLNMLKEIGSPDRIPEYLEKAKDKNNSFRLMGFGHRVYKNYDPRATLMQKTCHAVLEATNTKQETLFQLALQLEKIALQDPYFIDRKLYPNVDFYSGVTLNAIGIPSNLFTVIFALSRTVGWLSHWLEMMDDPHHALYRPRQWYTGPTKRDVNN